MAFESDICLVSNAVESDKEFIDSVNYYKYTSATDALGFKYILDYAEREGKPCVVSYSEGAHEDFYGDDQLMYEVLDSLSGPGRIIVASAGNEGHFNSFFQKKDFPSTVLHGYHEQCHVGYGTQHDQKQLSLGQYGHHVLNHSANI